MSNPAISTVRRCSYVDVYLDALPDGRGAVACGAADAATDADGSLHHLGNADKDACVGDCADETRRQAVAADDLQEFHVLTSFR